MDIDPQAVEVTKLSLLLKVLEGASHEVIESQLRLFHDRALPDLAANIKCGNSLIGPDFYRGQQASLFDDEERLRINVFDWQAEFPAIMASGGFDAVIGNPPWGADIREAEKPYLRVHYQLNTGKFESYIFFIEKATSLLSSTGLFGFIVPSYWISRSQTEALRAHLCGNLFPHDLIVLPENVFSGVKMDCCIVVVSWTKTGRVRVAEVTKRQAAELSTRGDLDGMCRSVDLATWEAQKTLRFNPRITENDARVIQKIEQRSIPLGEIVEVTQGLTLYRRSTLSERFGAKRAEEIVATRAFHCDHKKDETFKKELWGTDVSRFDVHWNGCSWVSYGPWLAHAVDERFFRGPRLVIQKLRNPSLPQRLVVGYLDDNETYSAGVLLNAITRPGRQEHLHYVMGILNSRCTNWWYRKCVLDVSIRVVDLRATPVPALDLGQEGGRRLHDRLVELVERMMSLKAKSHADMTAHERTALQRQIAAMDREIDGLVYELYGLNDAEINIVEEATAR